MHEQVVNEVRPIRAPAETLRGGVERCLNSDLFLALFLFVRRTSEHVDGALLSEDKKTPMIFISGSVNTVTMLGQRQASIFA